MGTRSGPQGTGLVPVAGFGEGNDDDENDDDDAGSGGTAGTQGGPAGQQQQPDPALIDGVPPATGDGGTDGDGDGEGEGAEFDPEAFRTTLLDEMQRRFDRAVGKVTKHVRTAASQDDDDEDDDDGDDDGDGKKPKPKSRRRQHQQRPVVDVRSIRVLVRDRIADEMESAGSAERRVVKDILDRVVPVIDWSQVDDEDELVDDLVGVLRTKVSELVKVGSDRKVAQLRGLGLLPEKEGQSGGGSGGGTSAPPKTKMEKGSEIAKRRWPEGKRRMGS